MCETCFTSKVVFDYIPTCMRILNMFWRARVCVCVCALSLPYIGDLHFQSKTSPTTCATNARMCVYPRSRACQCILIRPDCSFVRASPAEPAAAALMISDAGADAVGGSSQTACLCTRVCRMNIKWKASGG